MLFARRVPLLFALCVALATAGPLPAWAEPSAGARSLEVGRLLVVRARAAIEAAHDATEPEQRDKGLAEARDLLQQAGVRFGEAEMEFATRLKKFPTYIEPGFAEEIAAREKVRGDLIQARLSSAAVLHETARTYPTDADQAREVLQQAADDYQRIYEDFRTRVAGQTARIKQGQCYAELGDTRRAVGLWADILQQPEEIASLRPLRLAAMHLTLECWNGPLEQRYELATIKGEEWLRQARVPQENAQTEWLAVRYQTAVAHVRFAATLPEGEARTAERDRARELAQHVVRHPGPWQAAAAKLLDDLK